MVQATSRHAALKVARKVCTGIVSMPTDKDHYVFVRRDTFHEEINYWLVFSNFYSALVPRSPLKPKALVALESSSKHDEPISPSEGVERSSPALSVLFYYQTKSFSSRNEKASHENMTFIVLVDD